LDKCAKEHDPLSLKSIAQRLDVEDIHLGKARNTKDKQLNKANTQRLKYFKNYTDETFPDARGGL
jgi:hypothetical protein